MARGVNRISREVGAHVPTRSVCLVTLSLSEAGPGRFGRQPSVTDIYHTMPSAAVFTLHYHTNETELPNQRLSGFICQGAVVCERGHGMVWYGRARRGWLRFEQHGRIRDTSIQQKKKKCLFLPYTVIM